MYAPEVYAIQEWFKKNVRTANGSPYLLDVDQAAAVLDVHKNTLLTARAGSGKTHTLVAKIIYLLAIQKQLPNEIMAFVFNRDAADEINSRLRNVTVQGTRIVDDSDTVARTFHSFAHKTVSDVNGRASFGKILMDGEHNTDTTEGRSLFIQDIISRTVDSDEKIKQLVYTYFRKQYFKVDKESFDSPDAYYERIRNHDSRTLDGKSVKSHREKWIADFLFEHGVRYKYEPEYYPSNFVKQGYAKPEHEKKLNQKQSIKADFYLRDYQAIWEHWAITGKERPDEKLAFNQSSLDWDYDEYAANKEYKKWFYAKEWLIDQPLPERLWYSAKFTKLIETSCPANVNREMFEQYLVELCEFHGIRLKHYSREELVEKAWKKQVKYFTGLVTQFIDRTQQMYFDDIDGFERKIMSLPELNEDDIVQKRFYQIGMTIYREYLRRLSLRGDNGLVYINIENESKYFGDYGTDFSMLLQESLSLLSSGRASSHLIKNGNVKSILVDEFQDFSRLFYENLCALRSIFPESKLFCVGDNWQAINRFAGSEDQFYEHFAEYFNEDSAQLMLLTNYRSSAAIVDTGNNVMRDLIDASSNAFSKPGVPDNGLSKIVTIDLQNYQVAQPKDDSKFDINLQKYIEVVSRLIVEHKNDERIIILHRRNKMLMNYSLWGFVRYRVRDFVTNDLRGMTKKQFDSKVRLVDDASDVLTVHKSKGLEAETVILLELDPKTFPGYSNNIALFSIFGDSDLLAEKDEARLLYVALTRAKKNLYALWGTYEHSSDKLADFVKVLVDNGATQQDPNDLPKPMRPAVPARSYTDSRAYI